MSFDKAIQRTNSDALAEFSMASLAYKSACSKYTKVRRVTVDQNAPTDEAIVAHHRAHTEFKQACREYNTARLKWISAVQVAQLSVKSASNEDLYAATLETNDRAIAQQMREDAIARSITPEEIQMQKDVLAARMAEKTKDSILSERAFDPTDGDFEPLP